MRPRSAYASAHLGQLGAYAAVRLAELISSVGLPQENPKSSARELYKRFQNGDLDLADSRWRSIREFHCNHPHRVRVMASLTGGRR